MDFEKLCEQEHPEGSPFTLEECLEVFHYFFRKYEDFTGKPHPPLKGEQIHRIMVKMPYLDDYPIEPESYKAMIDKYFRTPFPDCDYRINHFFSGQIRRLRYYEECY